jgi:hypothetical protein
MRRGKTGTLGLMERKRFTTLDVTLVAIAPALFVGCFALWIGLKPLYRSLGGAVALLLVSAVLVGGVSLLVNDRLPTLLRVVFGLAYIGFMLIVTLYVLVATELVLV